jgi:hypothetical protein
LEPIRRDRSRDVRHKWNCFNSQVARRVQQLTWEQFSTLVQKPCTYCGGGANEQSAALAGIDRIDSAVRRYALANCVCDVQLHEGAPSFCGVFGQDSCHCGVQAGAHWRAVLRRLHSPGQSSVATVVSSSEKRGRKQLALRAQQHVFCTSRGRL